MKYFTLLFCIVTILTLSCQGKNYEKRKILGTRTAWQLESFAVYYVEDNGYPAVEYYNFPCDYFQMKFHRDGTVDIYGLFHDDKIVHGKDFLSTVFKESGAELNEPFQVSFTYEIHSPQRGKLTLNGNVYSFEIHQDAVTLSISYSFIDDEENPEYGFFNFAKINPTELKEK